MSLKYYLKERTKSLNHSIAKWMFEVYNNSIIIEKKVYALTIDVEQNVTRFEFIIMFFHFDSNWVSNNLLYRQ